VSISCSTTCHSRQQTSALHPPLALHLQQWIYTRTDNHSMFGAKAVWHLRVHVASEGYHNLNPLLPYTIWLRTCPWKSLSSAHVLEVGIYTAIHYSASTGTCVGLTVCSAMFLLPSLGIATPRPNPMALRYTILLTPSPCVGHWGSVFYKYFITIRVRNSHMAFTTFILNPYKLLVLHDKQGSPIILYVYTAKKL